MVEHIYPNEEELFAEVNEDEVHAAWRANMAELATCPNVVRNAADVTQRLQDKSNRLPAPAAPPYMHHTAVNHRFSRDEDNRGWPGTGMATTCGGCRPRQYFFARLLGLALCDGAGD